jgi:hypothetical protein
MKFTKHESPKNMGNEIRKTSKREILQKYGKRNSQNFKTRNSVEFAILGAFYDYSRRFFGFIFLNRHKTPHFFVAVLRL